MTPTSLSQIFKPRVLVTICDLHPHTLINPALGIDRLLNRFLRVHNLEVEIS